jgi:hypothetical protein
VAHGGTESMTEGSKDRPIKSRWRRRYVILGALVLSLSVFGYVSFHDLGETVPDAYAQWWVAAMVISYMEWNEGSWPRDWEDLKVPYEISVGESGRVFSSLDELRTRVAIDFAADPAELSKVREAKGERPFRVIYLRNGKDHYWMGNEPNLMILQYLRERARRPSSHKCPKSPDREEAESRQLLVEIGAKFAVDDGGHVVSVNLNAVRLPNWRHILAHLKQLNNLRQLQLGYANIADDDLEGIKDLSNLEELSLYGTKVTDAGLSHLRGMSKLRGLGLADRNFTDAGLNHVKHLHGLRILNLNGARITDSGLKQIYELVNLQEVLLGDTYVTADGLQELREALPNCDVYHDQVSKSRPVTPPH